MSRTILKVSGDDAHDFLQGLVTNDVKKLKDGLVYAAMLSPQGKYLADFFLVPWEDGVLIDTSRDLAPGLAQRLNMYKLRAAVDVAEAAVFVHRGIGDIPADGFGDPRHSTLGWRAYRETSQTNDEVDWDALRVDAMVPEAGTELFANDSYILEMGFERLNGVDFKKGCYVGQEVTARMKHKTELRKGLAQVSVVGPAESGTVITLDGKSVGTILTRSGEKALAYLRLDRAVGEMAADSAKVTRR